MSIMIEEKKSKVKEFFVRNKKKIFGAGIGLGLIGLGFALDRIIKRNQNSTDNEQVEMLEENVNSYEDSQPEDDFNTNTDDGTV